MNTDYADDVHIPHPVKALIMERAKLAEENSPEAKARAQAKIDAWIAKLDAADRRRAKWAMEQDRRRNNKLAKRRAKKKQAKKSRRRNR